MFSVRAIAGIISRRHTAVPSFWLLAFPRICMPIIAALQVDGKAEADEVAPAVEIAAHFSRNPTMFVPDSRRAWIRLAVAVLIGSLGSVGMWSVVVVLPVVQTEFGASRGTASLATTAERR